MKKLLLALTVFALLVLSLAVSVSAADTTSTHDHVHMLSVEGITASEHSGVCTCGESFSRGHYFVSLTPEQTGLDDTIKLCECGYIEGTLQDETNGSVSVEINHHYLFGSVTCIATPVTCTDAGFAIFACGCGNVATVEYMAAKGHTYSSQTAVDSATHTSSCADCSAKVTEPHTFAETERVEPTCVNEGYVLYGCACGYSYSITLEVTDHSYGSWKQDNASTHTRACSNCEKKETASHEFSVVTRVNETCTSAGYVIYRCACMYIFTETIPAKGHTFGDWAYVDASTHERTCSDCNATEAEEHSFVLIASNPPRCDKAGYEEYYCQYCSLEHILPVDPIDHPFGEWETQDGEYHFRECAMCGLIEMEEHSVEVIASKEATCTEDGYVEYECFCGYYCMEVIWATGHTFGEWEADNGVTHSRLCTCGAVESADHVLEEISRENSTCVEDGYVEYECFCGYYNLELIWATGHSFGQWTVDDGYTHTRACHCGALETEDHVLEEISRLDGNCTEDGYAEYKCFCGYYSMEIFWAPGHDFGGWAIDNGFTHSRICATCNTTETCDHAFDELSREDATCTEEGYVDYKCKDCGYYCFEMLWPTGHEMGEWVANDSTTHIRTCLHCDVFETSAHVFSVTETVYPDCLNAGYTKYNCGDCGYEKIDTAPALGHSFDEWSCYNADEHIRTCGRCGYEETETHSLSILEKTEATCTTTGHVTYSCSVCGYSYSITLPALEHDLGEWNPDNGITHTRECAGCDYYETSDHVLLEVSREEATCTEEGYVAYECFCGYYSVDMLWPTGHTMGNWEPENGLTHIRECASCDYTEAEEHTLDEIKRVEPTCEDDGYAEYVCFCGYYRMDVLLAHGHEMGGWVSDNDDTHTRECNNCDYSETSDHDLYNAGSVASTCTEKGYVDYACTLCEYTKREYLDVIEHELGEWNPDNSVTHTRWCASCDFSETVAHDFDELSRADATCTEEGYVDYKCADCGYYYLEILWPTDHSLSDWTENGKKTHIRECLNCDYFETEEHDFELYEHIEATCTDAGSEKRVCIVCGYEEITILPVPGHRLGNWECYDSSKHIIRCRFCDYYETEEHSLYTVLTVDPLCTVDGYATYACSVCSYEYSEVIPALGHLYGEWEPVDNVIHGRSCVRCSHPDTENHDLDELTREDATCTSEGFVEYGCDDCGYYYLEVLWPTGHTMGAWTSDNDKTHTRQCSDCDYFETEAHDISVTTNKASCLVNGYIEYNCTVCDYASRVIIPAPGHEMGAWTSDNDETHTRQCVNCDYVETESHTAVEVARKDSTCTEEGYVAYECICGYGYQVTLPYADHVYGDAQPDNGLTHTRKCENCDSKVTEEHTKVKTSEMAPTCTEEGYAEYECFCGYYCLEILPMLDHVYADAQPDDSFTHSYVCVNCGDTLTEDHALEEISRLDPTCVTDGYVEYECFCGYYRCTVLPIVDEHEFNRCSVDDSFTHTFVCDRCSVTLTEDHTIVKISGMEATCTEEGYAEYECFCGYYYLTIIPAPGHAFGDWVCDDDETHTKSCACGEAVTEFHIHELLGRKDATCTEDGYVEYGCFCGFNERTIIKALGHSLIEYEINNGNTHTKTCGVCGEHVVEAHVMDVVSEKAPTCTESGYKEMECVCGYASREEIGIVPHDFGNWSSYDDYTHSKTCSVCGENEFEDHDFNVVTSSEPTLTEPGFIVKLCKVCNKLLLIEIPSLHEHTEEIIPAVLPTPSTVGYTAGIVCSDCGETIKAPAKINITEMSNDKSVNTVFRVAAINLSAQENISVNFKALVTAGYNNPYAVFVFDDKEYVVNEYTIEASTGRYVFNFDETRPQLMASNITTYLYAETAEGEYTQVVYEKYSVLQYITGQLKKNDPALTTVMSDILYMGAMTQLYMGVNTNKLVTSLAEAEGYRLTPTAFTTMDAENQQAVTGDRTTGTDWKAISLAFGASTEIVFKFETDNIEGLKVRVNVAGRDTYYDASELTKDGNRYVVYFDGARSYEYEETVTATFERNGVQVGSTFTYSINTFLLRNYQNTSKYNANAINLMKAIYIYGESIAKYFA